jgi:hypothetical protein
VSPEGDRNGRPRCYHRHVKRVFLAGALASWGAVSLAGCYWLASYQDLTSAWGEAEAETGTTPGDAGREAEAEAGPFCPADAGPLAYCMDFDGIDAASLGLGASQASAKVVAGTYVSPPSSLEVNLYGAGGNGGYNVSLPLKPKTVRLEFEILPMVLGQWITTLSIGLFVDSTQTNQSINVGLSPEGAFRVEEYFSLGDGGVDQNDHTPHMLEGDGGVTLGVWHHVVLTLTVDDQNQQYLYGLTVDDQVFENAEPLALSWSQGNVSLANGVNWTAGNGPKLYFDNVRADFGL